MAPQLQRRPSFAYEKRIKYLRKHPEAMKSATPSPAFHASHPHSSWQHPFAHAINAGPVGWNPDVMGITSPQVVNLPPVPVAPWEANVAQSHPVNDGSNHPSALPLDLSALLFPIGSAQSVAVNAPVGEQAPATAGSPDSSDLDGGPDLSKDNNSGDDGGSDETKTVVPGDETQNLDHALLAWCPESLEEMNVQRSGAQMAANLELEIRDDDINDDCKWAKQAGKTLTTSDVLKVMAASATAQLVVAGLGFMLYNKYVR